MNLELDSQLLERMSDGVIVLNQEGRITDFNRAARPWLKHCRDIEPQLNKLISEVAGGAVQMPIGIRQLFPSGSGGNLADIYLCHQKPQGYAIFIASTAPEPVTQTQLENTGHFYFLLSEEVRHEISRLNEQLTEVALVGTSDVGSVINQTDRLSRLLVAIDQLAQIQQLNTTFQDERLTLMALIDAVLAEIQHGNGRGDYVIDLSFSDAPATQGVLYGNAEWLKCGLKGLFEAIGESAPPRSQIEIRVRQSGSFIVMTSRFAHAFGTRPKTRPTSTAPSSTTLRLEADIRLSLCRRIFKLHGGQLDILEMDSDNPDVGRRGIDAFTLVLPTGAPFKDREHPACVDCRLVQQAEAYAQDLAVLLPSKPAGSQISEEEVQFLAQMTAIAPSETRTSRTSNGKNSSRGR